MVNEFADRIAKRPLNVIMLVDCSTSMRGERIAQVNSALRDIKQGLIEMQAENSNVDFFITVIEYSTDSKLLNNEKSYPVEEFDFADIQAGGRSNLHLAYMTLADLLKKKSAGGIMPDFGGVAPILLLLTDGHPTKYPMREELNALKNLPWFRVALKYGIAIGLDDERTMKVLSDFVSDNGDVLTCFESGMLAQMIQVIVLTASKVASQTASISWQANESQKKLIKQWVQTALGEEDWEW